LRIEKMVDQALLVVDQLRKYFPVRRDIAEMLSHKSRAIRAVDNISFRVNKGTTLGLVGESGCGKTTTGKVILGLQKPTSGSVKFQGLDVHGNLSKADTRSLHREIQAVFQDPAASLDPRMTVEQITKEPLDIHSVGDSAFRAKRTLELIEAVGLTQEQYRSYSHELSGGQQQRVAIARALTLQPKFMILDEPVSALDMSVRAQILNLLKDLQSKFDLTYLFVAHDLSVIRYMCDEIAVMYLGRIVESCETRELFGNPLHPYTKALLDAVPVPDSSKHKDVRPLPGTIPSPMNIPTGCRFHTRCPYVMDVCSREDPELQESSPRHLVACHLYH
jgi:oligopeptide transport system ATP-binding protein